jgi:Tfp pilus assembly protein PilX
MTRLNLRAEHGVTMIAVMIVLLVATMIASASLLAAQSDLPFARASQDRKQAYAAAEAGIEYYLYQLAQDNDYWTKCNAVPAPAPVNQKWNGTGVDPRIWRALPGSTATYTIELLPNAASTSCVAGSADTTMLDPATGTFRIRSTGRMGNKKITRSIIASMRRRSFLDFLYFTDFETLDPSVYATQSQRDWAVGACGSGKYRAARDGNCSEIQFVTADANRGPFHTNDDILVCGSPTFGRTGADSIEVSGPTPGWTAGCGGGTPNFVGTFAAGAKLLSMPSSNASLSNQAQPGYLFTGTTQITLNGLSMDVTNNGTTTTGKSLPANGVIYVQNGTCGSTYSAPQTYNELPGCAQVYVHGTTQKSLTIASARDIIVTNDLKTQGNVMMGLIADGFVRVYHPVSGTCTDTASGPFGPSIGSIEIDAAIMSVQHSFIVDNYNCGTPRGTLTVKGAIAQSFRGPVGTGGSSVATGYVKNYNYDDRFRVSNPPFFLDPVQSSWRKIRFTEQTPARQGG